MANAGTALGLIGLVAIVVGLGLAWLPLGVIAAGVVLLLSAVTLERPAGRRASGADRGEQQATPWTGAL